MPPQTRNKIKNHDRGKERTKTVIRCPWRRRARALCPYGSRYSGPCANASPHCATRSPRAAALTLLKLLFGFEPWLVPRAQLVSITTLAPLRRHLHICSPAGVHIRGQGSPAPSPRRCCPQYRPTAAASRSVVGAAHSPRDGCLRRARDRAPRDMVRATKAERLLGRRCPSLHERRRRRQLQQLQPPAAASSFSC